eukprot:294079-Rhodomonas_salina.1
MRFRCAGHWNRSGSAETGPRALITGPGGFRNQTTTRVQMYPGTRVPAREPGTQVPGYPRVIVSRLGPWCQLGRYPGRTESCP